MIDVDQLVQVFVGAALTLGAWFATIGVFVLTKRMLEWLDD